VIRVLPASIGFGDRLVGTQSASQRVTVTNEGGGIAVMGPLNASLDFVVSTSCGQTLAPGASCFADVAMRPVGFGPRQGQLLVNSNSAGSPHAVDLLGSGCRPFNASSNRLGTRSNCSP
jgi:secreted trypsin-like serine protease